MKTEKHTRKEIIDHNLQAAGWNVADRSQVIEEFDIEVGLPEYRPHFSREHSPTGITDSIVCCFCTGQSPTKYRSKYTSTI